MQSVQYPNLVESFKRAMHEVLADYFDGTNHVLGGIVIPFPNVPAHDIRFDIRPIDQTTKLIIALAGDVTVSSTKYKCEVDGEHGYELRARIMRTVFVVATENQPVNVNAQHLVDTTWSRLHNLFHMAPYEFADRSIELIEFSDLPDDIVKERGIIEATGAFTAELRVKYLAFNPV